MEDLPHWAVRPSNAQTSSSQTAIRNCGGRESRLQKGLVVSRFHVPSNGVLEVSPNADVEIMQAKTIANILRLLALVALFALFLTMAVVSVLEAFGYIDFPVFLLITLAATPIAFQTHMVASSAGTAAAVIALAVRKGTRWHKIMGWSSSALLLIGVTASVFVISYGDASLSSRIAFTLQATCLTFFLVRAIVAARRRLVALHRANMILMVSVLSGAPLSRLLLQMPSVRSLDPDVQYSLTSAISWLLPLIVTGFYLRFTSSGSHRLSLRGSFAR
jgi:uncharacterized membrane protein